jgi:type VI secretion system secreted protein VgrG
MNSTLKQDPRIARLDTPFGKDALVLTRFRGHEGMGELFEFDVDALAEKEVELDGGIGKNCAVTYKTFGHERVFNGILVEAEWLGNHRPDKFHEYRLVLRPWLWLLGHTADCRIFQHKPASDIIKDVFQERGFSDLKDDLKDNYPELEYCVQYRETDLHFVTRLMEQHGIYYYFEHSADKHTLVLVDRNSSHKPVPNAPAVPFNAFGATGHEDRENLTRWVQQRSFRTGKIEYRDYDYLKPTEKLVGDANGAARYNKADLEVYDYPGKYKERKDGEKFAKVHLDAEQSLDERRHAEGRAASLFPGGQVRLEKHPKGSENGDYVVVRCTHSISVEHYRSTRRRAPDEIYSGSYELQPFARQFRMQIVTPKPKIYGIQTAVVTGKKGEEIDVDDHGRIRVQFHWDRKGKNDESSSLPIRVAEVWSGKKWGGQFIPRIGMEVVVEFLEGDPDRPLVVGTVYNRDYKHPFDLPGQKTQSGIKTDSSKGHEGYNQLMFEDKKSHEKIELHAQKDYELTVLDTEVRKIGEHFTGETAGVASRKTTLVQGDDELTVAGGSQNVSIAMDKETTIGRDQSETIGMDETRTIGMAQSTTVGINITFSCGASRIVMTPASISLQAPMIMLNASGPLLINGCPAIVSGPLNTMVF